MEQQNSVELINSIIATDLKTGWNSAHVAGKLSDDVIETVASCFKDLDKQTKLDIMASFLHFRYRDLVSFRDSFIKIIQTASTDDDEFVKIMADMLSTFLDTQILNTNLNHWNHSSTTLNKARESINKQGIGFHAPEYMLLNADNRTLPNRVSATYTEWQPTLTRHFQVTNIGEDAVHTSSPFEHLKVLAEREERADYADTPTTTPQKRPSSKEMSGINKRIITTPPNMHFASPPTTPTAGGFPPRQTRPPPPRNMAAAPGSSLFITKPRRPAGKPIQRSPSGGVRSSANVPKGFQRPQKVQMLDFNAATELEHNNSEAIKKANDDIKAKKEEEKMEKKRVAEEKKKATEAKKARKASVNAEETKDEPEEQAEKTEKTEPVEQNGLKEQPEPIEPKQPPQLPVKKAYTTKKSEF